MFRGDAVTVIVLGILAHMIRGDGENVNVTISLGRTSIGHSQKLGGHFFSPCFDLACSSYLLFWF